MKKTLSFTALHSVLSDLSREELSILSLASMEPDGITFGEIEKLLRVDSAVIEQIATLLARKMLVYVLKNRQRLHNKLDKIHLYPEIRDILVPITSEALKSHFDSAFALLKHGEAGEASARPETHHSDARKLVEFIFKNGGMITLDEVSGIISGEALDRQIRELRDAGMLSLYHDLSFPFHSFILLNPAMYPSMIASVQSPEAGGPARARNHYYFLLNMLITFDVVSSSGLFLTKQREFRKIDRKRLVDSMLSMTEWTGAAADSDVLFQLCLYFFQLLECVHIKRDAVVISLKNLEKYLDNPLRFLSQLLKSLQAGEIENPLFPPPYEMPSHNSMTLIIELLGRARECSYNHIMISFLTAALSSIDRESMRSLSDIRHRAKMQLAGAMRNLALFGIIEIRDGLIALSDIGQDLLVKMNKSKKAPPDKPEKITRLVYINPDFTIIIPKDEIPSEAGYHLIAHTDVIKDDVILHTRIDKASVVRASKRGMTQTEFLKTLENYSKTDIPQNLDFLLKEWSNQTIRLQILDAILIHSSHPALIDDLEYSDSGTGSIQRIAPNYAIIDRKYLDSVIKIAQKKDAVITLFEESEESD